MKSQTMHRGEAKKAKLTKMEKAYNFMEKTKRRAEVKKKGIGGSLAIRPGRDER